MNRFRIVHRYALISRLGLLVGLSLPACRGTNFAGETPAKADPAPAVAPQQPAPPAPVPPAPPVPPMPVPVPPAPVPPGAQPCSTAYKVNATSNPYLAGVPDGTMVAYSVSNGDGSNPTDKAPDQNPVLVTPIGNCLAPGHVLTFSVSGTVTYASGVAPTDANGALKTITSHQKGALYGKSNITAPFNSLLGVFLGSGDPSASPAPPALDYSSASARDYAALTPQLGQIFYIGNGKTSSGQFHRVTVPAGATRLYFATMDSYQWNNNAGGYTGSVLSDSP